MKLISPIEIENTTLEVISLISDNVSLVERLKAVADQAIAAINLHASIERNRSHARYP